MNFDAREAKLLAPGAHITIDGAPGLRLEATNSTKAWTYRYKSPVDQKMRQVKIGEWPAMSIAKAMSEWEELSKARKNGADPALERRNARVEARAAVELRREEKRNAAFTVRKVCDLYLDGYIDRHRKPKGAKEVRRTFDTMLGDHADLPAATYTRANAFDLLERHFDHPVQCAKLRTELAAAWDYSIDAGKLPDTTPNWWRQILRGKLRSKGKAIAGEKIGTAKRHLSEQELRDLFAWLPNFTRTIEDALTLYSWTCTRGSEICAMEAKEITEEADGLWWTIPKAKTKNARISNATDLRVPLIGRAERIVRRRLSTAKGGYIFPAMRGEVEHVQQKMIQTAVWYHMPYSKTRPEQERPRLPVTHWAPHDLRRTSRTLLAALGCPDPVAEAILGHMQPGVKGVYNRHTYDKERREWLSRLDAKLEEIVGRRG
ncbi:MAG TPA: integrase family protein [Noviherbaspirillum sp.]|nr:integrase family protein [Noviherbaspirillum sp.]